MEPLSPGYNPHLLLRVYVYYRTLLGAILLLMFYGGLAPNVLGDDNPEVFMYTSGAYTFINVATLLMLWRTRLLPSQKTLFAILLVDLVAINLLMHTSGGVVNGLGYLTLVAVAAGAILLRGQIAIFFAAIACIALVSESIYRFFYLTLNSNALFSAASLGVLMFLIAFTFQYLTRKIIVSAREAQAQAQQAAHLQQLAQLILERMRTGIVVFNEQNHIELANQSALNLLALNTNDHRPLNLDHVPVLSKRVAEWREGKQPHSPVVKIDNGLTDEVRINFAPLETDGNRDILVFVEDNRAIAQQAQQLKLASLGRLTASIAHEIRNPLGAISHASQLLGESEDIPLHEKRLLDIINAHCKRVNQIIENVLQLSRRRTSQPRQVNLAAWLPEFLRDYKNSKSGPVDIHYQCLEKTVIGQFDPGQLHQVLGNLCDNGLRYSNPSTGKSRVTLVAGIDDKLQRAFIDVIDEGPGISEAQLKHLFEPFYTTENTGSGLGLYICKELCEANQAFIHYRRTKDGKSCFQIQLAHAERAL